MCKFYSFLTRTQIQVLIHYLFQKQDDGYRSRNSSAIYRSQGFIRPAQYSTYELFLEDLARLDSNQVEIYYSQPQVEGDTSDEEETQEEKDGKSDEDKIESGEESRDSTTTTFVPGKIICFRRTDLVEPTDLFGILPLILLPSIELSTDAESPDKALRAEVRRLFLGLETIQGLALKLVGGKEIERNFKSLGLGGASSMYGLQENLGAEYFGNDAHFNSSEGGKNSTERHGANNVKGYRDFLTADDEARWNSIVSNSI